MSCPQKWVSPPCVVRSTTLAFGNTFRRVAREALALTRCRPLMPAPPPRARWTIVAFVAGGGNFWVYVHDYETGEELRCNKGHHGPVYGVRFTPDGKTYASAGDDGTIRFWTFAEAGAEGGGAAASADAEVTVE